MHNDIEYILLTEKEIQTRVKEMGARLAEEYAGKNPVMICILKGSTLFFSDLVRAMPIPLTLDFMSVSSYGRATKSSGEVEIRKDLSGSIEHRHAVIVEDIIDSGFTLSYLTRMLSARGAKSIRICTLLDKPARRASGITLKADYSCFEIPDGFVVGYGLDYDERYRNLPYIGILKPQIYENN